MADYAYEDGLHNNDRALNCFSKRKVEESDKAVEIYLTETELQALAEMELTGLKDQVRDIFLVGCYTCQRVSDYNNIQPEDYSVIAFQFPAFCRTLQITPDMAPVIPFWVSPFPL